MTFDIKIIEIDIDGYGFGLFDLDLNDQRDLGCRNPCPSDSISIGFDFLYRIFPSLGF